MLMHGTPTLNTLYWTAGRSDEFCMTMARNVGLAAGEMIARGHTHKPWHREVEGIHFVNTESVGRPKDADLRAGYGSSISVRMRPVLNSCELRTTSRVLLQG